VWERLRLFGDGFSGKVKRKSATSVTRKMDQVKVKKWTEQITSLLKWVATSHNALSMWEKGNESGGVSSVVPEVESNILKDDIRRRHQALQKLVSDYQVEMEEVLNTSSESCGVSSEVTKLEVVIASLQAQLEEAKVQLKNAQEELRKKTPISVSEVADQVNERGSQDQALSICPTHLPSTSTQEASSSAKPVPTKTTIPKPPTKRRKVTLFAKSGNGKPSATATTAEGGSGVPPAKKQKAGSCTKGSKGCIINN